MALNRKKLWQIMTVLPPRKIEARPGDYQPTQGELDEEMM